MIDKEARIGSGWSREAQDAADADSGAAQPESEQAESFFKKRVGILTLGWLLVYLALALAFFAFLGWGFSRHGF